MSDWSAARHGSSPRHIEARRLAQQGIPVIPCIGKRAIVTPNGKDDESADLAQIDKWWAAGDYNIGVRPCHMGLVGIDLDHYKPKGVFPEILAMLPPTLTHMARGEHRFYKSDQEFGNCPLAVNVDVRSSNGYVIWPPSVVDGIEYRVTDNREPVPLPENVARNLKPAKPDGASSDEGEYPDFGLDVWPEKARAWLKNIADGKINHPGRYSLACALARNFGLSDKTASDLCYEYGIRIYPNASKTPWSATLAHARKHGQGKLDGGPAWDHPADRVDDRADDYDKYLPWGVTRAEIASKEDTARRFPRRRPSEAKDQPPMTWLDADNLFPSGPRIMVIYAEKQNLKTQFVLAKGLEIVARTGGQVLYIAAEDGHGIDTSRLPAYVEKRGLDWQTLDDHWWPISEPIDLIGDGGQLITDVNSQGFKPDVVVIDVMTACTGAADINQPGVGNSLMNAAQQLANGFGGALVVLMTHPGKDCDRGPVGSYAFTARADVVLSLKRQGDTLSVLVEKMKSGPSGRSLAFAVENYDGIPLIEARKSFERKRSDTDDDAILMHLATADARNFASGLTDHRLAERIVGERQPDEDTTAHATRITRMADRLKKRHGKTQLGENATLAGGKKLHWRWHLGPKIAGAQAD